MKYASNKDRILSALRKSPRRGYTAVQLTEKLNITGGRNAVYAYISALSRDGHSIRKMRDQREGLIRYSLG